MSLQQPSLPNPTPHIPTLTRDQVSDIFLTYGGAGRKHSTYHPLGRVMYRRHMTVGALSRATNINRVTISNYLCGDRPLRSQQHIRAMAYALGARVVDILTVEEAAHLQITLPDDATCTTDIWNADPAREDGRSRT